MPASTPYYVSERAWLEHLRVMAGLPYPSWALVPDLMKLTCAHVDRSVSVFVWYDGASQYPVAMWVDPVNGKAYCNWIANSTEVINRVMPSQVFIASRGRAVRDIENAPDYEQTLMYTQVFALHKVHWHMSIPISLSEQMMGFMGVSRSKEEGPYTDEEWRRWDRVGGALHGLDRHPHPWANLPPAPTRESESSSTMLWLARDGRFLTQGHAVRDILFLARQTGMGPPDWVHSDWRALPPEVRATAAEMFAAADHADAEQVFAFAPAQRHVSLRFEWGCFDFTLEYLPPAPSQPESTVGIMIRHHEPLDMVVARNLWGWPLSPREKRLLIASTRAPSLAQLAVALGLTIGTVKFYLSEIKTRLGVDSRQALVEWILATVPEKPPGNARGK